MDTSHTCSRTQHRFGPISLMLLASMPAAPAGGSSARASGQVQCPVRRCPGWFCVLGVVGSGLLPYGQPWLDHHAARRLARGAGAVAGHGDWPVLGPLPAGRGRQRHYVSALAGVLAAVHLLLLADHWLVLIAAWALVGRRCSRCCASTRTARSRCWPGTRSGSRTGWPTCCCWRRLASPGGGGQRLADRACNPPAAAGMTLAAACSAPCCW
jgi:hypothetical protein